MARSRVTIRDVAARAGVSHMTVSRVINDSTKVRPATRARVEAAIVDLGYTPSAIARYMAKGRTFDLACLAPNLTDFTFARIIEGAETELRQQGYFLFSSSAPDEQTFTSLIEEFVARRSAEGLIVINPYDDNRHARLPEKFPVVFVGAHARQGDIPSVALDDEAAARTATRHLIGLDHRAIALITGPLREDCSQDRCVGYRSALEEANLAYDPAFVVEGDWSATSGYNGFTHLMQSGLRPSAVFAQNDRMAIGAIRAARDLGLRVPDELSVMGIDDMPLASYFHPPLTTMRQDMLAIGREAARLLLRAVQDQGSPPELLRIPAELIIRSSTARVGPKEVTSPRYSSNQPTQTNSDS